MVVEYRPTPLVRCDAILNFSEMKTRLSGKQLWTIHTERILRLKHKAPHMEWEKTQCLERHL